MKMVNSEIEIWASEYELRQFIHLATRWKISAAHYKTESRPFGIFTGYVEGARNNFELFCAQLKNKLTESRHWKAIEIDLKDRFLPMIAQYLDWHSENKKEIDKLNPNAYELMLSVLESTKREILKYFPENNGVKPKNKNYCGMGKCKHYPNCKCFNTYEQPAKEIDADNSWLFVSCIKELEHALLDLEWIEFDSSMALILPYFTVVPTKLHMLFATKVYIMIETEMKWKMPAPTLTLTRISNSFSEMIVLTNMGRSAEYLVTQRMSEISEAQKAKSITGEEQRKVVYNALIDSNSYSPNILDFKEKAKIENWDRANNVPYLKFLRAEKERYTNAIFYYNIYGNSVVETVRHNNYTEILNFINTEIAAHFGEVMITPQPENNATPNDFILSTINEYLEPFRTRIKDSDYNKLTAGLKNYFETGKFSKIGTIPIGRVNIKALGWALNNIYRGLKQGNLSVEYLRFAKQSISTFKNTEFTESNYQKSQLYKYFTTKTQ